MIKFFASLAVLGLVCYCLGVYADTATAAPASPAPSAAPLVTYVPPVEVAPSTPDVATLAPPAARPAIRKAVRHVESAARAIKSPSTGWCVEHPSVLGGTVSTWRPCP